MKSTATPPRFRFGPRPDPFTSHGEKRAFTISLTFHGAILAFMILKNVVAPTESTPYIPSMRVDLVALPNHKVTDKVPLTPAATPVTEEIKEKVSQEKIKPDTHETADISLRSKKKPDKKSAERMKNALAKIKALEKISAAPIAGNQISKGSAITGEAKNALETTYNDVVLEKVRANWELPRWLQDQNYTAKVQLFLDRDGMIKSIQFLKNSGNAQFDQEVKRALQLSAPFPAPPREIVSDLAAQGVVLGFPI